jgi:hypothetical protein
LEEDYGILEVSDSMTESALLLGANPKLSSEQSEGPMYLALRIHGSFGPLKMTI